MKNILQLGFLISISVNQLAAQVGWTIYNKTNGGIPTSTYRDVKIDVNGKIWAGGWSTGLVSYDGIKWKIYDSYNTNLADDDIYAMTIDKNNKVWVGSYKGLSMFNGTSFTNYDTSNTVMGGMTVYTLGTDNNGKIWIASKNGSFGYQGITTYNGTAWTNLTGYPSQIDGDEMVDFAFPVDGKTWIAGSGISNYLNGTFNFYPKFTTGLWTSSSLAIDKSGNIWAAGFDGLLKYNGINWEMFENGIELDLPNGTLFYSIYADGDYLWMGTTDGLIKYSISKGIIEENYKSDNSPLEDNCVVHITKDTHGNLWLGTTLGVVKMDLNILSLPKASDGFSFSCFPNPASEKLTIISKGIAGNNSTAEVYDISGNKICEQTLDNGYRTIIDVKDWAKGFYILRILSGNQVRNLKVTVN